MSALPRKRRFHWRRSLAMATLAILLAPMAVTVTGCFTLVALLATSNTEKERRIVPAGDAIYLEPGQEIRLHLRDGKIVHGRFGARTLLDSERYQQLFDASSARGGWTPFALGESLTVRLDDGRTIEAPFGGYAMRSMILHPEGDTLGVRVPFESARSVRHKEGGIVSLDSLLAADVRGELPSAEAISLIPGDSQGIAWRPLPGTRQIPLAEVERATIGRNGGNPAGLILAGVALDVILVVLIRDASKPRSPSCDMGPTPNWFAHARWTERPFDRVSGMFVEENLAGLDSLRISDESGHEPEGTH